MSVVAKTPGDRLPQGDTCPISVDHEGRTWVVAPDEVRQFLHGELVEGPEVLRSAQSYLTEHERLTGTKLAYLCDATFDQSGLLWVIAGGHSEGTGLEELYLIAIKDDDLVAMDRSIVDLHDWRGAP